MTPTSRAKSTLQSRIDLLQQTLHFKTASLVCDKECDQQQQQVDHTPAKNLDDGSLLNFTSKSMPATKKARSSSITPKKQQSNSPLVMQSNVLKGIKEHKYDAIARLFSTKTSE